MASIRSLVVHPNADSFEWLEVLLQKQGIQALHAEGYTQTKAILDQAEPPQIVFTAFVLADGTWEDIVNLVARTPRPAPVIVVSRSLDIQLYVKVMESGAFDFIVPPISSFDLAHIVRCATDSRRNGGQARTREAAA